MLFGNFYERKTAMQKIYETHRLNDKPLPFIFHLDTITKQYFDSATMNWHPNIEILYFVDGEGTVRCDTEEHSVQKEDIFLVNSNLSHVILSDSVIRYHCLIIDNEFCIANNIDCESTIFKNLIKDSEAVGLYRNVINEYEKNDPYRNAGIKSAVLRLMVYIARNYTDSVSGMKNHGGAKTENIRRALRFIRSHSAEPLTLDMIASHAGLSKYYFLREFKSATGYTPTAYINKMRCENAKKLLLSSSLSISEVCDKTGFENLSYFSKKFKESEGCTPSQYIKKYFPPK